MGNKDTRNANAYQNSQRPSVYNNMRKPAVVEELDVDPNEPKEKTSRINDNEKTAEFYDTSDHNHRQHNKTSRQYYHRQSNSNEINPSRLQSTAISPLPTPTPEDDVQLTQYQRRPTQSDFRYSKSQQGVSTTSKQNPSGTRSPDSINDDPSTLQEKSSQHWSSTQREAQSNFIPHNTRGDDVSDMAMTTQISTGLETSNGKKWYDKGYEKRVQPLIIVLP
ncbi:unnamed protein product [Didymodactylos carnosus]|uniref:Uncharacterized protein n=1 Tax=Didymodactylos carnosus TaxID=1234261 RepID=A0A814UEU5_9BILA|nr:unnamed protein product [Didymodactylos carnosus]CAF1173495.1 unnamed protein product [Didymodactylos carnosus]CAF3827128.1 unnamed protein product [Didymodactylos carnosus]CAF3937364.1 unnamed protein product [Didymodactylos carnosus]